MSPKTLRDLRLLVTKAGGTLEEDEAPSDSRIFQAVAPAGKLWACDDLQCLVVWWARGTTEQAEQFNAESYADLKQRLSFGLRSIRADEADLYAED